MKIIQLNNQTLPGVLFEAVQVVKSGGVIVYPTDTVYGIGGNALDPGVCERICAIKLRPREKGFILLVKDHEMARRCAYIDLWTERVLGELWPGPVSVVLHKKDAVPDIASGGKDTIALRMPDDAFTGELLKQVAMPLIATSANQSEDSAPSSNLEAFLQFLETNEAKPDLVIDAGDLGAREASTLIDLTNKRNPLILRRGAVTKEELEAMLQPK